MFKYLKKYWYFALLAPLFMVGEVMMDLIQPGLMRVIIDDGVLGLSNNNVGNLQIVLNTGMKMIIYVVFGGFCGVMSGVFANLCSQNFGNDVRKAAFKSIMSLSLEQTDKFSTGSLITRVTNDVTQLQNLVMQCIRGFVRTSLLFAGGIYCMIKLDISFGAVIAIVLPVVLIVVVYFMVKTAPMFGKLQHKLDNVNTVMQENVSGARVVKAYVKEEYEKKRFEKSNKELADTQLDVLLLLSYMTPVMNIILNFAVVAVIKVGAFQVKAGAITPGIVMAAITYTSQILNAVMRMTVIFQTVSRGNASAKRIKEVIDCVPSIRDGNTYVSTENTTKDSTYNGTDITSGIRGKVEFINASFAYPGMPENEILSNINLTIAPGETVAVMGATGCGKSSLVSLIPRFYDVTGGSVRVDGIDVRDYKLDELRDKVSIALQKSEIFSATIAENIRFGDENATDEEVLNAAKIAQAAEFINNKTNGMDEPVSQNGNSLSGGQKQRLAISRAVLKKSEILIFDDSTSALDLKTEADLYEALKQKKGITKIIIAQRIASVKNADRIVILENGKISAIGNHNELIKMSSIYREICNSQRREA